VRDNGLGDDVIDGDVVDLGVAVARIEASCDTRGYATVAKTS